MYTTDIYGREYRYGPPAGYVPPEGQQSLGPDDWTALCAKGLSFEPYSGNSRLTGVRGDCLWPLVVAGRDQLVSRTMHPDEPLIDGALYLIAWNNDAEIQLYRDRMGIPATEPITIAKVLRYLGGTWYCQCKDSLAELNGTVVEQVVGVMSSCTEAVHCGQIGANATSQMLSNYSAASVACIFNSPVSNITILSATINATGAPIAIDVSTSVQMLFTASYTLTTAQIVVLRDGVLMSQLWDGSGYTSATALGNIPVTLTLTDTTALGSHTYTLAARLDGVNHATGNFELKCSQNFIKIREIKK